MSDTVELLVGKVGRAHGVRGDLTIDVRTDEPERRFASGTVFATRRGPLTVETTRWHGSRLVVRFREVADRTVAETWRGTELRLDVDARERPDDPEEFYDHQLVGLRVESERGDLLATVEDVLHLPAQDLLVVRRSTPSPQTDAEAFIPFVSAFVPSVDVTGGRLVVRDTAGLLGEEDADELEAESG